jgi:hypothetical protein
MLSGDFIYVIKTHAADQLFNYSDVLLLRLERHSEPRVYLMTLKTN